MSRLAPPPRHRTVTRSRPRPQLRITVLSGGPGAEREVSLKSGQAVAGALRALGHDVYCGDARPDLLTALDVPTDLVFIALHGEFGEDGRLQQILEDRGIPYCGSGPAASALAMNKPAAKQRFLHVGVPTPAFETVTPERLEHLARTWPLPAVVKPIFGGSSIDCHIVTERGPLKTVLDSMVARYERCLIEQYIAGPEVTVGILGETALPPIQIRTTRGFYNYQAKYLDDTTEYLFDIDVPSETVNRMKTLSLAAHQALGCRDFSRVDFMVDAVTSQPYVLEVNTIPGFTDHSLLPKAARQAGLNFSALCQRIVDLTLARTAAEPDAAVVN